MTNGQPQLLQAHRLETPRAERHQRSRGDPAAARPGGYPVRDLPGPPVVNQRDVAQPLAGHRIADHETFGITSRPQPADRRAHLPGVQLRRLGSEALYQRITHLIGIPGRITISPLPEPDHPSSSR